jgi:hypothetical protein
VAYFWGASQLPQAAWPVFLEQPAGLDFYFVASVKAVSTLVFPRTPLTSLVDRASALHFQKNTCLNRKMSFVESFQERP